MRFLRLTSLVTSLIHFFETKRAHLSAISMIALSSTTILLYQNCAPSPEVGASSSSSRTGTYSSTIGGYTGGTSAAVPGGVTPTVGSGGTEEGITPSVPAPGGAIPVDGSGSGSGGTGVLPGGGTGGGTTSLVWQYQPEDLTIEEGGALTLSAYATKGLESVSYQWYKNGTAIAGATSYLYRQFLVPRSAAGQYYVVAKAGAEMIRSYTVTLKVRSARASCPAGFYGLYPGSRVNVYWHESAIGRTNARIEVKEEVEDAYIKELASDYPVLISNCAEMYQCRNGKFYGLKKTCPTTQISDGF